MNIKIIHTFPCFLLLLPMSSFAGIQSVADRSMYRMDKLSINAAAGYLGGQANEYVYDEDGRKLSELNWKIQGAAVLKGEVNLDFLPWLTANANGWTTLDNNNAVMDDYDWLNPAQAGWTHWSHHPDTDLNNADNVDLNVRAWFLQNQHYKLGATVGYEQNEFGFLATGGCYQYNNGRNVGCFPADEPMIGYQQTFDAAYIGLVGKLAINTVELNAAVKYGPGAHASDTDEHYARDLTFTEEGNNSTFTSATLSAGYYVNPVAKLFFEASWTQFSNGRADTTLYDNFTGESFFIRDGAGLSNTNYVLALGVQYAPFTV